jgi:hypothetical protein
VLASDPHTGAACNLHRGCLPYLYPGGPDTPEDLAGDELTRMVYALKLALKEGLVKSGERVVLCHGISSGSAQALSHFRMIKLA